MEDSIAQPRAEASLELPAWKSSLSVSSAIILALLFIIAGTWKITDPLAAAERMTQALIPGSLSLPFALLLGIAETFAGVLLVVPRFRRWGAWLSGLLLIAFLFYFGLFYGQLRGAECNCFPWIKRVVGPAFFIGDGVMLLLTALAGLWARPSESRRSAALVLAAVAVFAGVSYGVTVVRHSGIQAPPSVMVEGQPVPLHRGRVFLYFFDPECSNCYRAAQQMATYNWKGARVIAIPTAQPQFAAQFLADSGLKASVSNDLAKLRATFAFGDPPHGVALVNGEQKAAFSSFDEAQPKATLKQLGFIE